MDYLEAAKERDLMLGDLYSEIRSAPRGVAADPLYPYHTPDKVPDFEPRFRHTMDSLRRIAKQAKELDRQKLSLDSKFVRSLFSLATKLISADTDSVDKAALRSRADSLARLVAFVRTNLEHAHGSRTVPLPTYPILMRDYAKISDLDAATSAVLSELKSLRDLVTEQASALLVRIELAGRYNDALHGNADALDDPPPPPQNPDPIIQRIEGIDIAAMTAGLSGSSESISTGLQSHTDAYMSLQNLQSVSGSADELTEEAGRLSSLVPASTETA
nr:hypothetical protein TetV2_00182 [Oceanusvirus sp.]